MIALSKETESRENHDRVEEVVLVLKEELSGGIEGENTAVESRVDGIEEFRREGEEGHELDIGIVLGVIGDY